MSLETGAEFYDVRAVEQVGYDFIGVGSRDLSLSPSLFSAFALNLDPTVPAVNSVIDGTFEQSWQRLRSEGRLANALLTRAAGRRVLVLGAVDQTSTGGQQHAGCAFRTRTRSWPRSKHASMRLRWRGIGGAASRRPGKPRSRSGPWG